MDGEAEAGEGKRLGRRRAGSGTSGRRPQRPVSRLRVGRCLRTSACSAAEVTAETAGGSGIAAREGKARSRSWGRTNLGGKDRGLAAPTWNGLTETSDPRPSLRTEPRANPLSWGAAPPHCLGGAGFTNSSAQLPSPSFYGVQVLNFPFQHPRLLGCQLLRSGQRYQPHLCLFLPWEAQRG